MTLRKIVNPSDQTQAFLPQFVGENYQTFVNFMAKAAEAQERQGFGQDLLQNLQRYRDFDTYAKGVVETGVLAAGTKVAASALKRELAARGLGLRVVEVTRDQDVARRVAEIADRIGADEVHVGREFGVDEAGSGG